MLSSELELSSEIFRFVAPELGALAFSFGVVMGVPRRAFFTGATASLKANAQMSSFAAPKWALRALSTSLAKEFAPQGIHVVHAIIDGPIDIPKSQELLKSLDENARIGPDDIADTYWNLHTQTRRGFTNEIDIRSMLEKW